MDFININFSLIFNLKIIIYYYELTYTEYIFPKF